MKGSLGFPFVFIDYSNYLIRVVYLKVFGAWIQYLLEKMFKGTRVPVRVVGNRIQVDRFTSALIGEKKYMDSIRRNGLDSPMTYKQRAKLNRSIERFEQETGISWPLK